MRSLFPTISAVMIVVLSASLAQGAIAQSNYYPQEEPEERQQKEEQDYQKKSQAIAPMEDIMEYLKQTSQRSSRLKREVPYALPMMDIGTQTPTGYSPESMDINGDGMEDLVLSYSQGQEKYQVVLLNTGEGFEAAYLCGYTNANDSTGQFTYRGDCAEVRE